MTGATTAALVHRPLGLLGPADEVAFVERWGVAQPLAQAEARGAAVIDPSLGVIEALLQTGD